MLVGPILIGMRALASHCALVEARFSLDPIHKSGVGLGCVGLCQVGFGFGWVGFAFIVGFAMVGFGFGLRLFGYCRVGFGWVGLGWDWIWLGLDLVG